MLLLWSLKSRARFLNHFENCVIYMTFSLDGDCGRVRPPLTLTWEWWFLHISPLPSFMVSASKQKKLVGSIRFHSFSLEDFSWFTWNREWNPPIIAVLSCQKKTSTNAEIFKKATQTWFWSMDLGSQAITGWIESMDHQNSIPPQANQLTCQASFKEMPAFSSKMEDACLYACLDMPLIQLWCEKVSSLKPMTKKRSAVRSVIIRIRPPQELSFWGSMCHQHVNKTPSFSHPQKASTNASIWENEGQPAKIQSLTNSYNHCQGLPSCKAKQSQKRQFVKEHSAFLSFLSTMCSLYISCLLVETYYKPLWR